MFEQFRKCQPVGLTLGPVVRGHFTTEKHGRKAVHLMMAKKEKKGRA